MAALAEAAEEISAELDGASVEVRLKGREPVFVVDAGPEYPEPVPAPGEEDGGLDDSGVVRITLRIPVSVKARAEELAARAGTVTQHLARPRRAVGREQRRHRLMAPGRAARLRTTRPEVGQAHPRLGSLRESE